MMQKTMQNDCAVFRTTKTLAEGCANMDKVFAGKATSGSRTAR
jgi:succinate dehydrogenase / fumarate reductase flavoprotein subunit